MLFQFLNPVPGTRDSPHLQHNASQCRQRVPIDIS